MLLSPLHEESHVSVALEKSTLTTDFIERIVFDDKVFRNC